MNDEELAATNATQASAQEGDPLSEATAEGTEACRENLLAERDDSQNAAPKEPLALSDDPLPHSDPVDPAPALQTAESELEQLRGELKSLREQLSSRDAMFSRLGKECEEFGVLYPDHTLSDLPDAVWEDVRRGVPLAAAFALSERRRVLTEQKAQDSNAANNRCSSGSLEATNPNYFSPAEVRAMTPAQVREHYHQIMLSMSRWHS